MLALVKAFLEAPIVDERDDGRPRRNAQGTPQGGVISPLLANIYLNLLDRNFRRQVEGGNFRGRLIRYADDFVVLTPRRPDRELAWVGHVMRRLGLALHPEKTRVVDAGTGHFTFLGHTHFWRRGNLYLDIGKKAQRRIRDELRSKTRRTGLSLEKLVQGLNLYIRGARQYFRRVLRKRLSRLDHDVTALIARWAKRKHTLRRPAWSLVRGGKLHSEYALELWNLPPALRPADSRRAW
jgi:RNA-directed DNA polymerase